MGATNIPNDIDNAFLRRFPIILYIPLPTPEERCDIITYYLRKAEGHTLLKADIKRVSEKLDLFSPANLAELVATAYRLGLDSTEDVTHYVPLNYKHMRKWPDYAFAGGSPSDPMAYERRPKPTRGSVMPPPITLISIAIAMKRVRPNAQMDQIDDFNEFNNLYGQFK